MVSFRQHLEDLLSSHRGSSEEKSTEKWIAASKETRDDYTKGSFVDITEEPDSLWAESIALGSPDPRDACGSDLNGSQPHSQIVDKIISKAGSDAIIEPILRILRSPEGDEQKCNSLLELIGLDDVDLVMDIMSDQASIEAQLQSQLSKAHAQPVASLSTPELWTQESAQMRMREQFKSNAERPLFTGTAEAPAEVLPHVYSSSTMAQGNVVSHLGSKYMLPIGTERTMHEEYEEVVLPPAKPIPPKASERLITLNELDPLVKGSFMSYTSLNRIQSIVYPTAYGSNENLLICAPTGAGKTDVAMLTILRVISQHSTVSSGVFNPNSVQKNAFKIIYVAPMKALASEIVRKLGKRLQWLSIEVRELTGDMQLTRAEIARTQIIVTTPEKWDVVTRKPTGEGELSSTLRLLIIDEVHLLNEERGAVIETIVARTLRQVESSQSMIRIVGLSATLPNYIDVADFLCVSRQRGLFYFDSSFRPIPLEQHFIGVKGKPGSQLSRKNLDFVTFQKVSELVKMGHQVMVFVHARKETVKAAMALKDTAVEEGVLEDFSCQEDPKFSFHRQRVGESRNKEMKILFDHGFGIHHAGMLRSDRNLMERLFDAKLLKVLCCTSTLAWGVNLPAHAVVIKGTQVYDSSKGKFVDLSVLDVLQVFGRAGRPGFETSGEGYLCTTEDKLTHYLDAVTSQIPIESQFQGGLIDALNAEIALGTVSNVDDAVQWLGYTYLFVRMRRNPFLYGIPRDSIADDPQLGGRRNDLIVDALQKLASAKMINLDGTKRGFQITELGRIAARYYISRASVEVFNNRFRPKMSEADVLAMLSLSTEFEQIQVRESEVPELESIMERIPCDVQGGTDTSAGKVNILLQGFISREMVEDFALVSDMAYAAQNGGRIVRALLDMAISKKWAHVTTTLFGLSKSVEGRLWPFDHPLRQFALKPDTLHAVERWADDWSMAQLASSDAETIGKLVHLNETHGQAILNAAKQFPSVTIEYHLQPIAQDVLKITILVNRAFDWNAKLHGSSEQLWLWIEDTESSHIHHISQLIFHSTTTSIKVVAFLSVPSGQLPAYFTICCDFSRWLGAETAQEVSLDSIIMPLATLPHTPLLGLPLLRAKEVKGINIPDLLHGRLASFNNLQTHAFWNLVQNKGNTLLCGPSGSGKTMLAEIAILHTLASLQHGWTLVISSTRHLSTDLNLDLRDYTRSSGIAVQTLSPDLRKLPGTRSIIITTASDLLRLLTRFRLPSIEQLKLVVCDELELLNAEYELAIALLKAATQSYAIRYVGLSSSLHDCKDLAGWLDVSTGAISSFRPQDRDQSLTTTRQTFTIPYSSSLYKSMAKPAHRAISQGISKGPALVFVPSKGHCQSVARDLITECTLEAGIDKGYLSHDISEEALEHYLVRLEDVSLHEYVSRGIGFFHAGVSKKDRNYMLELYADGLIKVLILPRESCWYIPVRATTVVVMGTQYAYFQDGGSQREIRDYSLTELVKMQSRAVQQSGTSHFALFCPSENLDIYTRFLEDGLPLESQLLETDTFKAWAKSLRPGVATKQNLVDLLSFTYFSQRVVSNPSYYGFSSGDTSRWLSSVADELLGEK